MELNIPRVIISGVKGKIGKTTITIAILYMLGKSGLKVQPFKVGPDFIDPTYHRLVSNVWSRNLDAYLMSSEEIIRRFCKYCIDKDIAIIEGVLGLYDSVDGISEIGSTAHIAKILKAPVVLVVDVERMNRSILPIIRGFRQFDEEVNIRGIILTNIANPRHAAKMIRILENENVEIIGLIPRSEKLREVMIYRHLGLIPTIERRDSAKIVDIVESEIKPYLDINALLRIAREVEALKINNNLTEENIINKYSVNIGIIFDEAFSFYYPEVLEKAHTYADKVHYISSISTDSLPKIDILIIGGGFPEVYAEKISRNKPLMSSIRKFVENNGVVYAECGGLMYLTSSILTLDNEEYDMCAIFDAYTVMKRRPVGHGYVEAEVINNNIISSVGQVIRGHEFHHSKIIIKDSSVKYAYKLRRGFGIVDKLDGLIKRNVLAQYLHVHPSTYNYVEKLVNYVVNNRCN